MGRAHVHMISVLQSGVCVRHQVWSDGQGCGGEGWTDGRVCRRGAGEGPA